jgi:hypothetical protein
LLVKIKPIGNYKGTMFTFSTVYIFDKFIIYTLSVTYEFIFLLYLN